MSRDEIKEFYEKLIERLSFERDTSTKLARYRGNCLDIIKENNSNVSNFLERMIKIIKTQPPENLDEWCIKQLEIMISLLDGIEVKGIDE